MGHKNEHAHHHDEAHGHTHSHGANASRTRLAIALGITAFILVSEVVVAILTDSLALLADAGHMTADSAGLVLALVVAHLAHKPATDRSTWGLRRAEIIGAAIQAGGLAVIGIIVAVRAVMNLVNPPQIESGGMLIMGVIGLVANVASLLVLMGGREANLNMRAAFLEVANDALGSIGVIVAAAIIHYTNWTRADALASLLIVLLIFPRAALLLRSAGMVLMGFTPENLDLAEVRDHMLRIEGVEAIHDLHAWTVATGMPVLTAHIIISEEAFQAGRSEQILDRLQNCVAKHFPVGIKHSTFQLETAGHLAHEQIECS